MGDPTATVLRDRASAEGYVASICFKHGPPRRVGVELEWTVHHADDLARPLDPSALRLALGPHAPTTLSGPGSAAPSDVPLAAPAPLRHGSTVTVEPGGQVELSTAPHDSVAALLYATAADVDELAGLLAAQGLVRGFEAVDPHRAPTRLLRTPRYTAMQKAFDRLGPHGTRMMCSTASLQVCLDVGPAAGFGARWAAVHGLGPVLTALFANSASVEDDGRAWESARMRAVLETDPCRSLPSPLSDDPVATWTARVLDTPLLCVRRPDPCWDAPAGVTFADWVGGALPTPPTADDLEYHLSTLFPPVRPRGYLEVRYLDAQPDETWMTPVALLVALTSTEELTAAVAEATRPVSDLWFEAARWGLGHPGLAAAASRVLDLGVPAIEALALPPAVSGRIVDELSRRSATVTTTHR